MKKLFALMLLAVAASATSFASDVVGHSADVAAKDSVKASTYSVKEVSRAGVSVVKVLF